MGLFKYRPKLNQLTIHFFSLTSHISLAHQLHEASIVILLDSADKKDNQDDMSFALVYSAFALIYKSLFSYSKPPITRGRSLNKSQITFRCLHQNKAEKIYPSPHLQLKNRSQKLPGELIVICVVTEEESTCF